MTDPNVSTPVQPAKPQEVSVDLNAINSATGVDAHPRAGTFRLHGEHQSQCAACGRCFTTTANFDKHRVWTGERDDTNRRRECVDPSTVGLVQGDNGAWRGPSRPGGWSR